MAPSLKQPMYPSETALRPKATAAPKIFLTNLRQARRQQNDGEVIAAAISHVNTDTKPVAATPTPALPSKPRKAARRPPRSSRAAAKSEKLVCRVSFSGRGFGATGRPQHSLLCRADMGRPLTWRTLGPSKIVPG